MAPEGQFFTSDGGRYLWSRKAANNFCVQMMAKSESRIVLRTPYLAARVTNVKYTPLIHSFGIVMDVHGSQVHSRSRS